MNNPEHEVRVELIELAQGLERQGVDLVKTHDDAVDDIVRLYQDTYPATKYSPDGFRTLRRLAHQAVGIVARSSKTPAQSQGQIRPKEDTKMKIDTVVTIGALKNGVLKVKVKQGTLVSTRGYKTKRKSLGAAREDFLAKSEFFRALRQVGPVQVRIGFKQL